MLKGATLRNSARAQRNDVHGSATVDNKNKKLARRRLFYFAAFFDRKRRVPANFFHGIIVATQAFRQQTIGQQPTAQAKRTKTGMLVR
jgi:hypothetical protein